MISVSDNDDGLVQREFETESEALAVFNELVALAPFNFDDLVAAYGFDY
jgi:hypothetical protein